MDMYMDTCTHWIFLSNKLVHVSSMHTKAFISMYCPGVFVWVQFMMHVTLLHAARMLISSCELLLTHLVFLNGFKSENRHYN